MEKYYVAMRFGTATLVDVREPDFFRGEKKQEYVERAGHITGALNLPASEAYTKLGTFKTKEELETIAARVVGTDKSKEI
ncbi:MAG: rhodanese-related sulfurtransferase, partial [Deltaproteobacteria bacterium]|nr:rhodanese-related sulfurtransferase [Deltaproteobacteria bacterium]